MPAALYGMKFLSVLRISQSPRGSTPELFKNGFALAKVPKNSKIDFRFTVLYFQRNAETARRMEAEAYDGGRRRAQMRDKDLAVHES